VRGLYQERERDLSIEKKKKKKKSCRFIFCLPLVFGGSSWGKMTHAGILPKRKRRKGGVFCRRGVKRGKGGTVAAICRLWRREERGGHDDNSTEGTKKTEIGRGKGQCSSFWGRKRKKGSFSRSDIQKEKRLPGKGKGQKLTFNYGERGKKGEEESTLFHSEKEKKESNGKKEGRK